MLNLGFIQNRGNLYTACRREDFEGSAKGGPFFRRFEEKSLGRALPTKCAYCRQYTEMYYSG